MSQENVELVRSAYAAYNEGDWEGARDVYHSEVIWDLSTYEGWPDTTEICGADAVVDWLRDWASIYSDYYSRIDQTFDSGDQVVVLARLGGRERNSTEFAEMTWAQVTTVRDGKIIRVQNYSDRGKALEAVGLSEQDAHADS
jgi:ketosteroid isomerase-like protein